MVWSHKNTAYTKLNAQKRNVPKWRGNEKTFTHKCHPLWVYLLWRNTDEEEVEKRGDSVMIYFVDNSMGMEPGAGDMEGKYWFLGGEEGGNAMVAVFFGIFFNKLHMQAFINLKRRCYFAGFAAPARRSACCLCWFHLRELVNFTARWVVALALSHKH